MSDGIGSTFRAMRKAHLPAIMEVIDRAVCDAGLEGTSLAEMIDYQMQTGGKRLRAILPLMVADILGHPAEELVAFGTACELIHNATLVHDDLQDGDRMRRGQPAVWTRFGEAQAINLGDALLYLAPRCLDYLSLGSSRRWAVASKLFGQVLTVIEGQEREFQLNFETASWDDYERMVIGKTSGLFAVPLVGTAQICGESEHLSHALEQAALHMGVIFQLQDDVVDLYGDKGRQTRGGDLREGKISALVVAFRQRGGSGDVARLRAMLSADRDRVGAQDVAWAAAKFRQSGALEKVLTIIDDRRRRALAVAPIAEHSTLQALIDGLIELFLDPIDNVIDS